MRSAKSSPEFTLGVILLDVSFISNKFCRNMVTLTGLCLENLDSEQNLLRFVVLFSSYESIPLEVAA